MLVFESKIGPGYIAMKMLFDASIYPMILLLILTGIDVLNGFILNSVAYVLFFFGYLTTVIIVFFSRRYYISKIELISKDEVIITYYNWFRRKVITLETKNISIKLSPIKYSFKYFQLYDKETLLINQFPFLEWNMNRIHHLKEKFANLDNAEA